MQTQTVPININNVLRLYFQTTKLLDTTGLCRNKQFFHQVFLQCTLLDVRWRMTLHREAAWRTEVLALSLVVVFQSGATPAFWHWKLKSLLDTHSMKVNVGDSVLCQRELDLSRQHRQHMTSIATVWTLHHRLPKDIFNCNGKDKNSVNAHLILHICYKAEDWWTVGYSLLYKDSPSLKGDKRKWWRSSESFIQDRSLFDMQVGKHFSP